MTLTSTRPVTSLPGELERIDIPWFEQLAMPRTTPKGASETPMLVIVITAAASVMTGSLFAIYMSLASLFS